MSDLSDIEIADLLALPSDPAPKAPTRPQDGEPEPNAYMQGVAGIDAHLTLIYPPI